MIVMYPDDRVLVAYVPTPADFKHIQQEGWYRVPCRSAPKGLHSEYFAFYFGQAFGVDKWAIHYYAETLGHELVTRIALLPDQPDHPRAQDLYYKVQLGPLQRRRQPVVSLRWRRITFIHTTWDRFVDAVEINDLLLTGGDYVDRFFTTLKDRGLSIKKTYRLDEAGEPYTAEFTISAGNGREPILLPETAIPATSAAQQRLLQAILQQIGC